MILDVFFCSFHLVYKTKSKWEDLTQVIVTERKEVERREKNDTALALEAVHMNEVENTKVVIINHLEAEVDQDHGIEEEVAQVQEGIVSHMIDDLVLETGHIEDQGH